MEKINLIFDAEIITNGLWKNASRSGIYNVVFNVLKELFNRSDIHIHLYIRDKMTPLLIKCIEQNFPNSNYKIISDYTQRIRWKFYDNLFVERVFARIFHKKLQRCFYSLLILCLSPINTIITGKKSTNIENFNTENYSYLSLAKHIPNIFCNCKKFLFLHDITPLVLPEYFPDKGQGCFKDLTDSLTSDINYFANSENTRKDFLEHFPQINPQKIHTTLLACDEKFKPEKEEKINLAKEKYNIPKNQKYVFSLCTLEPRKNLVRTVKTFIHFIKKNNIEDLVFVLGGGHWDIFIEQLNKEISELGDYKEKIIKIGYVDDEDLPSLYSGAEWFVYTSQYEGFGLPPLEAMSCGCPVITSNNTSLPEVVGNAEIMIDWNNNEQHIESYEKYYFDENLRLENSKKGLVRAKNFSWQKCTNEIIEVIKNVAINQ